MKNKLVILEINRFLIVVWLLKGHHTGKSIRTDKTVSYCDGHYMSAHVRWNYTDPRDHMQTSELVLQMVKTGAGEMTSSIKCLLSKHEDLSLGPQNPQQKTDTAEHTSCDRMIPGVWLASQYNGMDQLQVLWEPCLSKVNGKQKRKTPDSDFQPQHTPHVHA